MGFSQSYVYSGYHMLSPLSALVAVALLQFSTGVHATGGAFVNFSAATAAASFIGAKNLTFIRCEGFADGAMEAEQACVTLLGHTRGQCSSFPVYGNSTSVAICTCIAYAGLTPPGNCVDATCVWGGDACSVRQWQNYVGVVLHSFAVLQTAYVFGFGIYVIAAGRKNLRMNSMTATLVFVTSAAMFHLLWRFSEFMGYAVLLSTVPGVEVQKPVALPGFALCSLIGVLAYPLQWLEVAKKTARIKASRGGSSKAPHIAAALQVAVSAFVIAAATTFFAVKGRSWLISGTFSGNHRGCVRQLVRQKDRENLYTTPPRTHVKSPATHTPCASSSIQLWALGFSSWGSSSTLLVTTNSRKQSGTATKQSTNSASSPGKLQFAWCSPFSLR